MSVDRPTVRLIAEYSTLEEIALLCAHLADHDPRFAALGRRAEDQQYQRRVALETAGFALPHPDERTAHICGRTYQLPDVTASVVREVTTLDVPVAHVGTDGECVSGSIGEVGSPRVEHPPTLESVMATATPTTDPNVELNGATPAPVESKGFFAKAKEYCTLRNGVLATAVVIIGSAVYLAVTSGSDVPEAISAA